jgi:hypothetical protein
MNEPAGLEPTTYGLKARPLNDANYYHDLTNDVGAAGARYNSLLKQVTIAVERLSAEQLRFVLTVVERECARSGWRVGQGGHACCRRENSQIADPYA